MKATHHGLQEAASCHTERFHGPGLLQGRVARTKARSRLTSPSPSSLHLPWMPLLRQIHSLTAAAQRRQPLPGLVQLPCGLLGLARPLMGWKAVHLSGPRLLQLQRAQHRLQSQCNQLLHSLLLQCQRLL